MIPANSQSEQLDLQNLKFLFTLDQCGTQYDITNQIPLWVIYEKQDRESNNISGLSIFDFIQKYYDWLYCDNDAGAQYELSKNFIDNIDIEKCRTKFLERLSNTYFNGFNINALEQYGGLVKEENLRTFLKNIQRTFYQKKTTEDGIRYLFSTLYGVDEENIKIEVPKKFILRLNGGRFYDSNFIFATGITGNYEDIGSLSGSYLNGSRLQDSNWIQDWSYLLKVGIVAEKYKNEYLEVAHPAGLRVVFEKTLEDYRGPTFDETIPYICEYPMLKNYAPYGISGSYETSSTRLHIATGWTSYAALNGITLCGLGYTTGCTGYTGFSGPTHLFPSWTDQKKVFDFRGINISTMLELCYPNELGSPNAGASCG